MEMLMGANRWISLDIDLPMTSIISNWPNHLINHQNTQDKEIS